MFCGCKIDPGGDMNVFALSLNPNKGGGGGGGGGGVLNLKKLFQFQEKYSNLNFKILLQF